MSFNDITFIWYAAGIISVFLEFFLPGLIIVFLGAAAITVGVGRSLLILSGEVNSIIVFFVFSLLYLGILRQLVMRLLPSDVTKAETNDEDLIIGKEAIVRIQIKPDDTTGRVKFAGTTWPARSTGMTIERGNVVMIIGRENIALLVAPK